MPAQPTLVQFRDRDSDAIITEPIFAERQLRFFYESHLGRFVFDQVINRKVFCDWYGRRKDHPASRRLIAPFVARFAIDAAEAERPLADYESFNAFFERRLRPGARPFPTDAEIFPAPGDGKILVFPQLDEDVRLPVKGLSVSPAALLADVDQAAAYAGGAAFVLRIAPYDYHRFHFPAAGEAGPAREVPGVYHSVNPIALARVPDLFIRNKRMVTTVETPAFGRMAIVEVGAITVGTILQDYAPGPVLSGQEKGRFRYGGSTVVVLLAPGRVAFDDDLVAASARGVETRVRCGMAIGHRIR